VIPVRPGLFALTAVVLGLTSCSQEVEYTPDQRVCIAQRFPNYDAKKLAQCMDICQACMRGSTVTCSTSCKLKGAI
jgi:hypothetical protein